MSNKISFAKLIVRNGAVGSISKLLASGKFSNFYIDGRILLETLSVRDQVVSYVVEEMMKSKIIESGFDAVFGVPEGATKLGDAVSEHLIRRGLLQDCLYQLRLLVNDRKIGLDKEWVGGKKPDSAVVVEDTITTGGKAWEFVCRLRDSGVEINDVFCLVDRLQLSDGLTATERLLKEGIRLHALTTVKEVLPEYLRYLFQENPEQAKKFTELVNKEYRHEYEGVGRESLVKLKIPLNF